MRSAPPLLLPLFRSDAQARLLARLFLRPDDEAPLAQIAREIEVDPSAVSREVERLEDAGILRSRTVGRARLARPDETSPFYADLAGLITKALGPVAVLRQTLTEVEGVERAFVFGSWARRYVGEHGDAPGDIDLLVVGKPNRRALARAVRHAEELLAIRINPTVIGAAEWSRPESAFVRAISKGPLVPAVGSPTPSRAPSPP